MSTEASRPKGVSIWAHPMYLMIVPLIGVLALMDAIPHMKSTRELQVTIVAGLAVGLPLILIWKWYYRRCKDFWSEYYTTSYWERDSLNNGKTSFLFAVSGGLAILLIQILNSRLHLPQFSVYSVVCILCILIYPEQKAIWLAAKARLAEMESSV